MSTFLICIQFGLRQWRVILLLYAIQLILALIFGVQFYKLIENTLGKSLELDKLLFQYDHTVIKDYLKEYGSLFNALLRQLPWLITIWLVISTFLNTGLLYTSKQKEKVRLRELIHSIMTNYIPLLKISICFIVMLIIMCGLLLFPVLSNLEWMLSYFESEKYAIYICIIALSLFVLIVIILFNWSIASRLIYLRESGNLLTTIHQGWKKLITNKSVLFLTFLVFIVFQLILFLIIKNTTSLISSHNIFVPKEPIVGIITIFLIQQIFIFIRVMMRLMWYWNVNKVIG